MHRTDTIDFVTVIEGETNVAYPGEDGNGYEITIKDEQLLSQREPATVGTTVPERPAPSSS